MRKYKALLTTLCLPFILCSCNPSLENSTNDSYVKVSKVQREESAIRDIIAQIEGLSCADDLYLDIPTASKLYEYTSADYLVQQDSMDVYDKQWKDLFEYFFPKEEFDKNKVEVTIHTENDYVITDWDELHNPTNPYEGCTFWYDYKTEKGPNSCCMYAGKAFGYGAFEVGKGRSIYYSDAKVYDYETDAMGYPSSDTNPLEYLEYVETYSPDSEISYPLANGSIRICDAVAFFEEYVNGVPYPEDADVKTVVTEVNVVRLTEDTYGYGFATTCECDGVHFDHIYSGTSYQNFGVNYESLSGTGFMCETDDVDYIYSIYRKTMRTDQDDFEEIISLENALKIFREQFSENMQFQVESIELIYTRLYARNSNGYIDVEKQRASVFPVWKVTLYNSNEDLDYVCYINAKDGSNFCYFSTKHWKK